MLAMNLRTLRGVRLPALSLTTIATVRRFDMLAPTGQGQRCLRKNKTPRTGGAQYIG
jgi:transcription termination factor Rho